MDDTRTWRITTRVEVERGRLAEWLSANVPDGALVGIEEVGRDE